MIPTLFGTSAAGGAGIDTTARAAAASARAKVDQLSREEGATVPAGQITINYGKIWLNGTTGALAVGADEAAMVAAGFTEQNQPIVVDEVVLSASDLSGAVPAGSEIGINVTTGTQFYAKAGSWSKSDAVTQAELKAVRDLFVPTAVHKADGETAELNRTNLYQPNDTVVIPPFTAGSMVTTWQNGLLTVRLPNAANNGWEVIENRIADVLGPLVRSTTPGQLPAVPADAGPAVNYHAVLPEDVVGTGTTAAPEFPAGIYVVNATLDGWDLYARFRFPSPAVGSTWIEPANTDHATAGLISASTVLGWMQAQGAHYTAANTSMAAPFDWHTLNTGMAGLVTFSNGAEHTNAPGGVAAGIEGMVAVATQDNNQAGRAVAFIASGPAGIDGLWTAEVVGGEWGAWRRFTSDQFPMLPNIATPVQVISGARNTIPDNVQVTLTSDGSRAAIRLVPETDWANVPAFMAGAGMTVSGQPTSGNQEIVVLPNAAGTEWRVSMAAVSPDSIAVDVGMLGFWAAATVPNDGWLPMSGGTFAQANYPELYDAISNGLVIGTISGTDFTLFNLNTGAANGGGYALMGLGQFAPGTLQNHATAVNGLTVQNAGSHSHNVPDNGYGTPIVRAVSWAAVDGNTVSNDNTLQTFGAGDHTHALSGDEETQPNAFRGLLVVRAKPFPVAVTGNLTINTAPASSITHATAVERDTGDVWIDGKPIYEKTVRQGVSNGNVAQSFTDYAGIDTLVSHNLALKAVNNQILPLPFYDGSTNSRFWISTAGALSTQSNWSSQGATTMVGTIRYTKR